MITHSIETTEDAFAYLDQLERHCGRQDEILSTSFHTPGPVRVGTRVRDTRRIGNRERESSYDVTEHDPPRRHSFRPALKRSTVSTCRSATADRSCVQRGGRE
jgi:hypothetical protein